MNHSIDVTRVLLVANRTAASPALVKAVRLRARQSPCRFMLLIPDHAHAFADVLDLDERSAMDVEVPLIGKSAGSFDARSVLELALPVLEAAAGSAIAGTVGDADPLKAVSDEMKAHSYDEIIVSTLHRRVSRWLHRDLPGQVAKLGLPVTTDTPRDAIEKAVAMTPDEEESPVPERDEKSRASRPGGDRLAGRISELVKAIVADRQEDVAATLAEIGFRGTKAGIHPGVTIEEAVKVFKRDGWACRYCGAKTVPTPVLLLLSSLFPAEFPHYPDNDLARVHPAYLWIATSLDHVHDVAGPAWRDEENLVTACWLCHTGRSGSPDPKLGWEVLSQADVDSDWDGVTGAYAALWSLAGQTDPGYHLRWLEALEKYRGNADG